MDVKLFDYELPEELIAQFPLEDRATSRMLLLNRQSGEIQHRAFKELFELLDEGDLLVRNDSRVMPARLYGKKEGTAASIELLLLRQIEQDVWEALAKPAKRLKLGNRLQFGNGELTAECLATEEEGKRLIRFEYKGIFREILDLLGEMPLPPYIKEKLQDQERYQTVYANQLGSADAPTA